jgi:hypothetical protein
VTAGAGVSGAGVSGAGVSGAGASGAGASGLRRFVKRPAGAGPGMAPGLPPSIQVVLAARAAARAGAEALDGLERCEMCREILSERHGHVVDLEKRALSCTCRACYLLFTHEGSAGGRYRAVPEHVYHDPGRPLTDADWNELEIPVAMAFFFYNSALGRVVAGYPSPGGVTECELDLAAWDRLAADHPLLGALAPDVEAILVNRVGLGGNDPPHTPPALGGVPSPQTPLAPGPGNFEVFLIPVDECYGLVGELRMKWQGFDGGAEARAALAAFLDGLRRRAVLLEGKRDGPDVRPGPPEPELAELSERAPTWPT